DLLGEVVHGFAYTGRGSCRTPFNRQKGLGHGDGDFAGVKGHYRAVALDHPQLTGGGGAKADVGVLGAALASLGIGAGGQFRFCVHGRLRVSDSYSRALKTAKAGRADSLELRQRCGLGPRYALIVASKEKPLDIGAFGEWPTR